MISREIKDQIDEESQEFHSDFEYYSSKAEMRAYVKGATKYAEKVAEKDKIIESKDLELAELKDLVNYYKDKADKGENILKSATDIHFIPGKEGDNLLAAKDREIEQLKEQFGIAERSFDNCQDSKLEVIKSKMALEAELAQLEGIANKLAKSLIKSHSLITTPEQGEALIAWQTWRNSK